MADRPASPGLQVKRLEQEDLAPMPGLLRVLGEAFEDVVLHFDIPRC